MKKTLAILILASVMLCACQAPQVDPPSSPDSTEVGSSGNEDVVDLPERLFVTKSGWTAMAMYHDFTVTEDTTLYVHVVLEAGDISLGIYSRPKQDNNRADMVPVYETGELKAGFGDLVTKTVDVSLEPGNYSVKVVAKDFSGTYEVASQDKA